MNETTDKQSEQKSVIEQMQRELGEWQTKIDEARVQMNLGAKEAEQAIAPHLDKLEQEYYEAKKKWDELESASTSAWGDIQGGLSNSLDSMQLAFENAKKHFSEKKDR